MTGCKWTDNYQSAAIRSQFHFTGPDQEHLAVACVVDGIYVTFYPKEDVRPCEVPILFIYEGWNFQWQSLIFILVIVFFLRGQISVIYVLLIQ